MNWSDKCLLIYMSQVALVQRKEATAMNHYVIAYASKEPIS
jgi:hypothetical protein